MAMTATAFFDRPAREVTAQIEAEFFTALKVSNSTFKKTAPDRFADLDAGLIDAMPELKRRPRRVLDIGVSSGVTTLELCSRLARAGFHPRIVATDFSVEAFILPIGLGCRVLIDPRGHVLQYDICDRALKPWPRRLDMVTGMAAVRKLAAGIMDRRARRVLAATPPSDLRRVMLVSPRIENHDAIEVMQDDIMVRNETLIGGFDIIRAANILNRGYFSEIMLRDALRNIVDYLAGPGSLLLIGRSVRRMGNEATLFRLDENGSLRVLRRFGAGSEIEWLATGAGIRRNGP